MSISTINSTLPNGIISPWANLNVNSINAYTSSSGTTGTFETINATTGNITAINSTTGNITNANISILDSTGAFITTLATTTATVGTLNATSENIGSATINNLTVTGKANIYRDSLFLGLTNTLAQSVGGGGKNTFPINITNVPTPSTNLTYINNSNDSFVVNDTYINILNAGLYMINVNFGDIYVIYPPYTGQSFFYVQCILTRASYQNLLMEDGMTIFPLIQGATGATGAVGEAYATEYTSLSLNTTLLLNVGDIISLQGIIESENATVAIQLAALNSGPLVASYISIVAL